MSGILLIEDSRTQAHTYRCLLEGAGYSVRHAATAEEAFQLCLETTPDLVLLDQYLGDKSGLEVCRRLKSDMTFQVIPIVVLTASQKERDHIAALDSGADRFLSKDSAAEELLAVVTGLLKSAIAVESVDRDTETRNSFLSGARLLAIDDSRVYLAELSEKLNGSGFQVTTALSGPEGLELLERESFHILVIDVVMPEMDGFEVCRRARAWANTHQKQFGLLILSGQENREVLLQALESGADDFVSKQQDMDVILAHITSLVRRVRMIRHIEAINQKAYLQDLALRGAEWQRQQADERAKDTEARAALNEELQLAKEVAEAANRTKSNFLASMSHELRTPLNGIIGFSEFLIDEKPGKLLPKQKEYLNDILNSGRHLLQLINDVLDLSKVEAGKMELHPEMFSVSKAIEEVCAIVAPMVQKKNLVIHRDVDPAVDEVTLDQQKFKQMLFKLLSNAVKFTDEGGTVDILASPHDGTRLRLQVRDTGIGIKAEDMGKLFVEFQQLDSGVARRYQGTGLGLVLTRKIVEFQHGTIGVESEAGKGSTFTVVLPRVSERVTA